MGPRRDPVLVPLPKYRAPALIVVVPGYELSEQSQSEPALVFVKAPLPPMGLSTVREFPPTLKVTVPSKVIGPLIMLSPLLLMIFCPPKRMVFLFQTTVRLKN